MNEYEEKAVSLALCPKLQDLTNRLKAVHMSCPLFDTARRVRNLERSYFKVDAHSNLGNLTKAQGLVQEEALKLKLNFSDAYLNLGNVYKALGMPQETIVCYQRALQVRPDYAMAFGNLASGYYEQGNTEMAILNYRRAITCDAGFLEAYN
ncbi:putative udp-n-acetylglucosamine--peptide n-acetylglucosaminyltransferase sec [Nicotiana attenuata]|uniref:Udp-n-acetylglucosamine--peptide n-acetylglucosaminyltransferase sec n=1 Tax=Nicotiana attenuata TaxID=49451 RepID=A0A314L9Q0_NICAT|nr:putative udp-n-acetylglucosamine--peptide n-acetylglucosaminyltransferase sec [Nicotiana attenuata]